MTPPSPRPWLKSYSEGVPADIKVDQYTSLVQLMEDSFRNTLTGLHTASWANHFRMRRLTACPPRLPPIAGFGFGQR
jgi:hypothetical protein